MSISAHCGSCNRELLLGQLVQPSDGFRCPVCGFAFVDPIADTLAEVETKQPGLARRHRAHWWARDAATQPTHTISHQ